MPDAKIIDERHTTKGGGAIRIEVWKDIGTNAITRYNLAYSNFKIFSSDNGRVVGFDNAHLYPGFPDKHHWHWYGQPLHNPNFTTYDDVEATFQSYLGMLKKTYQKDY